MNINNENGASQGNIIITIFISLVIFWAVVYKVVPEGNWRISSESAMKEINIDHPEATFVKLQKNIISYSEVTVNEGSKKVTYCLDADIFGNCDIVPCE